MVLHPVARALVAVEAFAAGKRAGIEWTDGRSLSDAFRAAIAGGARSSPPAAAFALAAGILAAARRREILVLGGAGFLVGSGIWARARARARQRAVHTSWGPSASTLTRANAPSSARVTASGAGVPATSGKSST